MREILIRYPGPLWRKAEVISDSYWLKLVQRPTLTPPHRATFFEEKMIFLAYTGHLNSSVSTVDSQSDKIAKYHETLSGSYFYKPA